MNMAGLNVSLLNETTSVSWETTSDSVNESFTNKTCPNSAADALMNYFVGGTFLIIFLIGTIGNITILFMIVTDKGLRGSVINHYIFNLGVADLILTLLGFPESVFQLMGNGWPMGLAMCKIYRFLLVTCQYVSITTLIAVCVERYIAIVHPFHIVSLLNSVKRVRFAIATIWIIAMATASPVFPFNMLTAPGCGHDYGYCVFALDMDREKSAQYKLIFDGLQFGLYFLVPLVIQVVLYSLISMRLFAKQGQVTHHRGGSMRSNSRSAFDTSSSTPFNKSDSTITTADVSQTTPMISSGNGVRIRPRTHSHSNDGQPRVLTSSGSTISFKVRNSSNSSSDLNGNETPRRRVPSLYLSKTRQQTSRSELSPTGKASSSKHHAKSDTTRLRHGVIHMLVACVVIHFVSYLPSQVYYFMRLGGYKVSRIYTILGIICTYINSAANPIIYFIFSQYYRKKFMRIYRWCFCRGRVSKDHIYSPRSNSNFQRSSFSRGYTSTTSMTGGGSSALQLTSFTSSPDTPTTTPLTVLPPVLEPEPSSPDKLLPMEKEKFNFS